MRSLKRNIILIVAVFSAYFLVSCESITVSVPEEVMNPTNPGSGGGATGGIMTAVIDGEAWQATNVTASISRGVMNVSGIVVSTGEAIAISMLAEQEGTYDLSQNSTNAAAYVRATGEISHTSNATTSVGGTIQVSTINLTDSIMSGTFSFTAFRFTDNSTVTITEGVFTNVPIMDMGTIPSNNTMSLKLDGNVWEPTSVTAMQSGLTSTISITGIRGDENIGLTLPDDIAVGDHELDSFFAPMGYYNFGPFTNATILTTDVGMVSITKHDTQTREIEGTFHFEAYELGGSATASITEGSFSATY
ncbi:MAG: DUF6252 family protein [Flammeovirgaceae bacterium]